MSDTAEKLEKYKGEAISQLETAGVESIDFERLDRLVGNLRAIIGNRDALYVAGTDRSERETVRKNFVVRKLGVDDRERGERAVSDVADRMSGSRSKNRAAFYYLLEETLA